MMKRFSGLTALVADAASPIGRAVVARLADEGATIMAADGDVAAARAVASAAGSQARSVVLDVTRPASWNQAIDATESAFGRLDVLVTIATAEYAAPKSIAETSLAEFRAVTAHNLEGAYHGVRAGVLKMRALGNGGSLVLITSALATMGVPGHAAFSASANGLRLMTKAAALACTDAKDGIRVNAVQAGILGDDAHSLLACKVTPPDIAAAVAFLASGQASYLTGAIMPVDGGMLAA